MLSCAVTRATARKPHADGYLLRDVINKASGIHFTSSGTPRRRTGSRPRQTRHYGREGIPVLLYHRDVGDAEALTPHLDVLDHLINRAH